MLVLGANVRLLFHIVIVSDPSFAVDDCESDSNEFYVTFNAIIFSEPFRNLPFQCFLLLFLQLCVFSSFFIPFLRHFLLFFAADCATSPIILQKSLKVKKNQRFCVCESFHW